MLRKNVRLFFKFLPGGHLDFSIRNQIKNENMNPDSKISDHDDGDKIFGIRNMHFRQIECLGILPSSLSDF